MSPFADKVEMQHRLFAELSSMFGKEVPLYDKSLLANQVCNRTVCDLVALRHVGFSITDTQIDRTSGERHGAIRIGRPDEFRWIARFFAAFAMEPHNFYDMANVGAKSQPIIATAFRSRVNPDHRVFSSLLLTDYFDDATRARIEAVLSTRQVFSDRAKELIERGEAQGGLNPTDAADLIREGTERIFKWTGRARDHALYKDLCNAGFKIAADIACFERHHLNHLTPNTLCMDLYTSAMKKCMGEIDAGEFVRRATRALTHLAIAADDDWMQLHFKHMSPEAIGAFGKGQITSAAIDAAVEALAERLSRSDLQLSVLRHAGFKDSTEGPSQDTPVLLRQDAYKALTEPVRFTNPDGTTIDTVHTARFGEIEERFYATTKAGRDLYDQCLTRADAQRDRLVALAKTDEAAAAAEYATYFTPFPKTLAGLIEEGLVYAEYSPTPAGAVAAGSGAVIGPRSCDLAERVRLGHARVQGLRHEDFLPVSAAGIFASNLSQYGTKTTAAKKPVYTQRRLEEIMGRSIVDADAAYAAMEAASKLRTYAALGLIDELLPATRAALEHAARFANAPLPAGAGVA